MDWRYLYCPLCSNRGKIVWGKQVFCQDCETADKPVRFKEERVMDTRASLPVKTPQEAELTGTDMGGGIRWDEAGDVIDWGIVGPPGGTGRTEAES